MCINETTLLPALLAKSHACFQNMGDSNVWLFITPRRLLLSIFSLVLLGFRTHVLAIKVWFNANVSLAQIQMMKKICWLKGVAEMMRTSDSSENIKLFFASKTWFHILLLKSAAGCSDHHKYQMKWVLQSCLLWTRILSLSTFCSSHSCTSLW